jgi:transcriptional/translational regulatory protein YebC/TACO1
MQFEEVLKAFNDKGWEPEVSEVTWKSDSETVLTGEDGEKMQRLLDALEDLDDVSQVYTTAVIE